MLHSMVTHHVSQSISEEMRTPNTVRKWSCLMGRQKPRQKSLYLKPMEKRYKSQWLHPWYYSTGWMEGEDELKDPTTHIRVYSTTALTRCINHTSLSLPKPGIPSHQGISQDVLLSLCFNSSRRSVTSEIAVLITA